MILLDPLMSRLDAKLDTHKDAEVRQALEPLVRIADQTNAAILGLIHLNKSLSTDPLTMLMGSRAFAAVARAVLFAMVDPEDETKRILGQPKNNLGRTDLPTLAFQIVSAHVADTDEGPVWTGRVDWQGESTRLLGEVLEAASDGPDARTATQEAGEWLGDWLVSVGGVDDSASIKRKGQKAGHSQDSLKRARRRIGALIHSEGFPRRTFWSLPDSQPVGAPLGRLLQLHQLHPLHRLGLSGSSWRSQCSRLRLQGGAPNEAPQSSGVRTAEPALRPEAGRGLVGLFGRLLLSRVDAGLDRVRGLGCSGHVCCRTRMGGGPSTPGTRRPSRHRRRSLRVVFFASGGEMR